MFSMRWTAAFIAVVLAIAGCGSDASPESTGTKATETKATGTASAEASSTVPTQVPIQESCRGGTPPPASIRQRRIDGPGGTIINTAWLGKGSTAAVLLHQTDGNGLCGFLFYADFLARQGIQVVMMDFCGYGQSICETPPAAPVQVKLVTDAARAAGARKVVLVGASMGGSTAVSAARITAADGIVDLSGPAEFGNSAIAKDAANVTMPALFAFSGTDPADRAAVRAQLPKMPTKRKVFLSYDLGHGYDLLRDTLTGELGPLAGRVATFVKTLA